MRSRSAPRPLLVLLILLGATPPLAVSGTEVTDAHISAALAAAGDNRPALEAVLEHFAATADAEKLAAARFLVANMPGQGYVITRLEDAEGNEIAYDPLAYDDFERALQALEALEQEHGTLDFKRDRIVLDVETASAAFLIHHVDEAFAAWRGAPKTWRPSFEAFLEYVLPYRGSQEPLDDWITPLRSRLQGLLADETAIDPRAVLKRAHKLVNATLHFNERYYLHPTDQGYKEMEVSRQGRCEDLTNMHTYAARSLGIPTAADFTPAWAHRDNNHAWNVLLDKDGRGHNRANAHAAKVYRKTFSIQRDSLPFLLPPGREAPNRFLASKFSMDVTDQYRDVSDVELALDLEVVADEGFAYACVFNGGSWVAIDWAPVREGRVTFRRLGRSVLYLPAVYRNERLEAAAPPFLLGRDGDVVELGAQGEEVDLLATAISPQKVSPDTQAVTPVSRLETGTTYQLQVWTPDGWSKVATVEATDVAPRFSQLHADGLYWLVAKDSRRLERPFTIRDGRQRFW